MSPAFAFLWLTSRSRTPIYRSSAVGAVIILLKNSWKTANSTFTCSCIKEVQEESSQIKNRRGRLIQSSFWQKFIKIFFQGLWSIWHFCKFELVYCGTCLFCLGFQKVIWFRIVGPSELVQSVCSNLLTDCFKPQSTSKKIYSFPSILLSTWHVTRPCRHLISITLPFTHFQMDSQMINVL